MLQLILRMYIKWQKKHYLYLPIEFKSDSKLYDTFDRVTEMAKKNYIDSLQLYLEKNGS